MNRSIKLLKGISSNFRNIKKSNSALSFFIPKQYSFSTQKQTKTRVFPYGQAGQFILNLQNRTYSLTFETIWEDFSQISYQGLNKQQDLFIIQKGKQVKIDDLDLQKKQNEYVKMHYKIPEDYTIRGKVNGSFHHIKNNVSSKTRSNSFQIQIEGYKNIYQWLNLQCQIMKISNKNGQIDIGSLTLKDCFIQSEDFRSKKVLFSGQIFFKVSHKMIIRSIVAYRDALTKIQDSGNIYLESLSGKLVTKNCKSIKIDRLLSCKEGINIQCDRIQDHIVIQSGSGVIQCLRQQNEILQKKIKLGKLHKGSLDFNKYNNPNSPYSKICIQL